MTRRAALALLLGAAPVAAAPCTVAGASWCEDTGGASMSAPVGLASLGLPRTWVVSGGSLLTMDAASGSVLQTTSGIGSVSSRPRPVQFGADARAVFVTSTDGFVWRVNPDSGACVWKTFVGRTTAAGVDITPGCGGSVAAACAGDQAVSAPTLRMGADEASSIIYVGTRYAASGGGGCGTSAKNRVYALNAATGEPVWVFNAPGVNDYRNAAAPYAMDFIAGSVSLDVWDDGCGEPGIRDRAYVGSDANGSQATLWALSATTGALVWSTNAGGIQATPVLSFNASRCERLYVGTKSTNRIKAYGITTTACGGGGVPCQLWSTDTSGNASFNKSLTQTLTAVHGGAHAGKILATAANATRILQDNGSTVGAVCSYAPGSSSGAISHPMIAPAAGKFFVGRKDGKVAQVDLATCGGASLRTVESGTLVGDAFMDADPTFTTRWLVLGNDAGRIVRFDAPW